MHAYVGSGHFFFFLGGGGSKFGFHFLGDFQQNEYFLGYTEFVDNFGGHHKIGLYLKVIPMHIRVFS